MGKINTGKVIIGGIVAFVVIGVGEAIRIPVFADQWREVFTNLGLEVPGRSYAVVSGVAGLTCPPIVGPV